MVVVIHQQSGNSYAVRTLQPLVLEFHNDVTRGPTLFGQDQLHAAS